MITRASILQDSDYGYDDDDDDDDDNDIEIDVSIKNAQVAVLVRGVAGQNRVIIW